ncbi:MAG TPA: type I methionyl aminopeptidase [Longimicrobiaceae bacterium]|nr:type I methionyl aminopeptidase [Longimicrobiaceae bacterium]
MSIESEKDLLALRRVGRIARLALEKMRAAVRAGVTTAELDRVGAAVLAEHGARSAPRLVYGFPSEASCISVNDEVVHGIPGEREIRPGDVVKLDVTAEKDGYMADTALTVVVPPATGDKRRLEACARAAFGRAMAVARAGTPVNEIGRAVEAEVRRRGFSVVPGLHGHGIGRTIHEPPSVPNQHDPRLWQRLTEGLVITVEPIIAQRSGRCVEESDGWTVRTADGGLAAHYEHTLVVTRGRPILLTAA